MPEVTLEEMLLARDERSARQRALRRPNASLVSFSLNIAGPVKDSPALRRVYAEGKGMLLRALRAERIPIFRREEREGVTGCEGLFLLDEADALRVKRICVALEEGCALGRLFDLDVLDDRGQHLSREAVGAPERACLICGAPGRSCASRRAHSVEQLQSRTRALIEAHFLEKDLSAIADTAVRALLWEVCTTPKPGLVDMHDTGSHRDMTVFHFLDSTAALVPYLRLCAKTGMETQALSPADTFLRLRAAGKCAEFDMLRATGGVNTHKGALFTMGLLCAALGRLRRAETGLCRDAARILDEVAAMTHDVLSAELSALTGGTTSGERQYLRYGLSGVRGQAAAGFPAVRDVGLVWLRRAFRAGCTLDHAGAVALVHLIACVDDSNMIARGGRALQQETAARLRAQLQDDPMPSPARLSALNDEFTAQNLSPGGCADLLAASYYLFFLSSECDEQ